MPIATTYPGVYIEEVPSGVRTITGVSTSTTAFVDFFARGPMKTAVQVTSFDDFTRHFGGLHRDSEASYAIQQFYLNGGSIAWVVRAASGAPVKARHSFDLKAPAAGKLVVDAASEGLWAKDHVQLGESGRGSRLQARRDRGRPGQRGARRGRRRRRHRARCPGRCEVGCLRVPRGSRRGHAGE